MLANVLMESQMVECSVYVTAQLCHTEQYNTLSCLLCGVRGNPCETVL